MSGTLTGIAYPLTKSVTWGLDPDFDVTAFADGRGKQTTWTYGDNAELDQVTFGDGKYFSYRYFKTGKLKTVSESGGTRQTFSEAISLRVTGINYAASGMVDPAYTYNADDTVSQIVDDTGTRTFTYTDSRLLESVTHTAPSAWGIASSQVVEYTYRPQSDRGHRHLEGRNDDGGVWDSFNLAGRLTSITNNFGETTSYAYDGEGKITSQTNENDTTTTYSYNQQRGWVTAIEHALLGTAFASYSLEYDAGSNTVGELTEVTDLIRRS